jgi:hypothetical protein
MKFVFRRDTEMFVLLQYLQVSVCGKCPFKKELEKKQISQVKGQQSKQMKNQPPNN